MLPDPCRLRESTRRYPRWQGACNNSTGAPGRTRDRGPPLCASKVWNPIQLSEMQRASSKAMPRANKGIDMPCTWHESAAGAETPLNTNQSGGYGCLCQSWMRSRYGRGTTSIQNCYHGCTRACSCPGRGLSYRPPGPQQPCTSADCPVSAGRACTS